MEVLSYLDECLKQGKIIRWPEGCMPLTFYIAPFRWYKAQNESYSYYQLVHEALDLWHKASNGKISFKIVNKIQESQINLDWKRVDRSSLGHCYFNFDAAGRLYSAEVQIGLSDGVIHQNYQNKCEVFHTILHEIGHALGLGHSPHLNDIMYVPHQYGITALSDNDKTTLKWLYSFSYGSTSDEILRSYNLPVPGTLDNLIYNLENKQNKSNFQITVEEIADTTQRDLVEEQVILAEIGKYNLAVQNINMPSELKQYINKSIIKKQIDDQSTQ